MLKFNEIRNMFIVVKNKSNDSKMKKSNFEMYFKYAGCGDAGFAHTLRDRNQDL